MKKADHALEGIELGITSLVTGIFDGLTGIVTKPAEGIMK